MTITDTAFRNLPAQNTRQCDVMKLIAFAAMVLDHLNTASGLNDTLLQACRPSGVSAVCPGLGLQCRPSACHAGRPQPPLADGAAGPAWLLAGFPRYRRAVVAGQYPVHFCCDGAGGALYADALLALSVYIPASGASYELRGLLLLLMSALCFMTTGRWQMMAAAGLTTSVLLLNAPSGGVMMLSGLLLSLIILVVVCRHVPQGERLHGGRWFAQLYALHLGGGAVPRLILLLLLILAPAVQATLTGRVVRVIDGDTVVVLTAPATEVRIRLAGIDAPEKGQPFGQRSRQFLASRVAGRGDIRRQP